MAKFWVRRLGSISGVLGMAFASQLFAGGLVPLAVQAQTTDRTFTYTCANGRSFQVDYGENVARFTADPGQTFTLRQVRSADGARYSNDRITLYTRGNEAFVELRGQRVFDQCVTQETSPAPQPLPQPINYRYNCIPSVANYPDRRNVTLQEAERLVVQRDGGTFIYRCQLLSSNTNPNSNVSQVTGTVSYRERIALPPNAVIEVELQDISRADAPAIAIARQVIPTNGQQVPIPFELVFNPAQINPANTYAVRARILVDRQLRWTSTSSYLVITQNRPTSDITILVQPVR